MNPFSFLIYDIKRLFGHGKTAILAIFSPVLILLLFATFLAPMISAGEGTKITCAFLNEDETESVKTLMDLIIGAEIDEGAGAVYPVKDIATGKKVVEDEKVSAFFYIPPNMYEDTMNGEMVDLDFYYSQAHAFESLIFYSTVNSSMSVFGQGIRMVYIAGAIALDHGVPKEEILRLWNEGSEQLFQIYMNRGKIIGSSGIFLPGGDYPLRFAIAILFTICSYCVSFPIIYLTNSDVSVLYRKRNIPTEKLVGYYFARLLSGAVLILCTFAIMYPVARVIRNIRFQFALSVLPAVILTAFVFSALGIFLGSVFKKGQSSLWAGLYFGFFSVMSVLLLTKSPGLPKIVSFLIRISPFRACVSIFSNALFQNMTERYTVDMLILFAAFFIFAALSFVFYVRRGSRG
ncbi:MAG: ABC transporter permease [Lachnospiraceae bacterium]|nr:ABC transporter permease [Lachnospiraceae bacterium]